MRHRVKASPLIPEELRELYGYLSSALFEARESLHALENLYMDAGVVALLNRTAPAFFILVEEVLVNNIILSIARLTDQPQTRQHENLTLSRLVLELSERKYSDLGAQLDEKCKRIEEMSNPVRLYRHKRLAHADKAVCLKANMSLSDEISISLIRELIKEIADFLNTFDYEFTKGETSYDEPISTYEGVTDFIAYLQKNA
jgi:AbiU2